MVLSTAGANSVNTSQAGNLLLLHGLTLYQRLEIPAQTRYDIERISNSRITREMTITSGNSIVMINENHQLMCRGNIPSDLLDLNEPKFHFSDGEFLYIYREEIHDSVDYKKRITRFRVSCES